MQLRSLFLNDLGYLQNRKYCQQFIIGSEKNQGMLIILDFHACATTDQNVYALNLTLLLKPVDGRPSESELRELFKDDDE